MFSSVDLEPGAIYTRAELKERFDITDQTLYTGIFRPAGYDSIWLFVTEHKEADRTAYTDWLDGNKLYWDGQTSGRKDQSIIDHAQNGQELLLFYRARKVEYPGGGFRYEGRFRYSSHAGANPTHFILQRVLP
jgi:hypothetical protein